MTRRYILSGRVQGVGFRYFVRAGALELGILGWVRNLPDGRVEALAQGDEAGLREFAQRLEQGPPLARVDQLREFEAAEADLRSFTIER